MVNRQLSPVHRNKMRQEEQERLEKIRPKLFSISERLRSVRALGARVGGDSSGRTFRDPIKLEGEGRIKYNPKLLFDAIDLDHDGFLNYSELQKILELNRRQLKVFVRRMHELDGESPNQMLVSRECFVRNFLSVLEETSNFGPSEKEAAALFDSMDEEHRGYIVASSLYRSKLTHFLTDPQINQMIKHFRRIEGPSSVTRTFSYGNFFSYGEAARDSRQTVSRDTFQKHYPAVLQEVVEEPEQVPHSTRSMDGDEETASLMDGSPQTVDLTFQDLCLTVTVSEDEKVYVVNQVSGRCRGGTMTALMGGSGAGECQNFVYRSVNVP